MNEYYGEKDDQSNSIQEFDITQSWVFKGFKMLLLCLSFVALNISVLQYREWWKESMDRETQWETAFYREQANYTWLESLYNQQHKLFTDHLAQCPQQHKGEE